MINPALLKALDDIRDRIARLESADGLSDTAFSLLDDRVKALENAAVHSGRRYILLETQHKQLTSFCSTLATDLSRIDNKSAPAAGTVKQRLEALEEIITHHTATLKNYYSTLETLKDGTAVLHARTRDLICTLQEYHGAEDGVDGSLPAPLRDRLRHLFNLTPNDLLTTPAAIPDLDEDLEAAALDGEL